jgi:hypothetical protein
VCALESGSELWLKCELDKRDGFGFTLKGRYGIDAIVRYRPLHLRGASSRPAWPARIAPIVVATLDPVSRNRRCPAVDNGGHA